MKNDMKDLPKRKCPRLKNYDYSSNGCYFITICTKDKKHLFGKYDVGAIHESPEKHAKNRCIELNCFGEIVKNTITLTDNDRKNKTLVAKSITPLV